MCYTHMSEVNVSETNHSRIYSSLYIVRYVTWKDGCERRHSAAVYFVE